jgi:hypothetical protein
MGVGSGTMNRQQRRAEHAGNRRKDNNPLVEFCMRLVAEGRFATEDEALVDVIKVFGAYMRGDLHPVDGKVAREIAASEAKAVAASPELMAELALLARGKRPMQ